MELKARDRAERARERQALANPISDERGGWCQPPDAFQRRLTQAPLHDRAAILEALREQLRRGDKSLIGNKGYRRFLKIEGSGHFTIDDKQVAQEERYDGLFVLRTDTEHDAETVAHVYKMLWMVEDTFRTAKCILETRPI